MISFNKFIIIFLILISTISIVMSKQRIDLNDYEEECYQYATERYVANYSYQDYKDGWYCIGDTSGWYIKNKINCSIVTKYYFFNSTRFTNECLKYHLVRYT